MRLRSQEACQGPYAQIFISWLTFIIPKDLSIAGSVVLWEGGCFQALYVDSWAASDNSLKLSKYMSPGV